MQNTMDLPLSIKVWLATNNYDGSDDPTVISATSLLKPIKSIILSKRAPKPEGEDIDFMRSVPSAIGTAIHTAIEDAWDGGSLFESLVATGIPESVAKRIEVNPDSGGTDTIPVYMEIRSQKKLGDWNITGKFDFVAEGVVEDFKSTSVYTWIKQTNTTKFTQQGSIYRWLRPDLITEDYMYIRYIFTDWSAAKARQDPAYPQSRILSQKLPLMSVEATESMLVKIISDLAANDKKAIEDLPICTAEEVWQRESIFKYYKNPEKKSRSTKNFATFHEAQERLLADGSVGEIVEAKGEVVFCKYCDGVGICPQAADYVAQGMLTL